MGKVLFRYNCCRLVNKKPVIGGIDEIDIRVAQDLQNRSFGTIVAQEKKEGEDKNEFEQLLELDGSTPQIVEKLVQIGLKTVEEIANSEIDALKKIKGIGASTAAKLIESAQFMVEDE